jgi:hypothetical protein
MVEFAFRAISSGQLSLGIAEPSNYNFILRLKIEKIWKFFTARNRIGHHRAILKSAGALMLEQRMWEQLVWEQLGWERAPPPVPARAKPSRQRSTKLAHKQKQAR